MKMKVLPALVVVAILLAAVLAPAMGLSLLNDSNSSFPVPVTPTPSPPVEESDNNATGTDTEADETEIIDDEIPLLSENLRIVGKDSFGANETPEFVIEIEQSFIDAIADVSGGEAKHFDQTFLKFVVEVQFHVEGCEGNKNRLDLFVEEEETSPSSNITIYRVTIPNNKTGLETPEITPGIYTLVVVVGEQSVEHAFEWGLKTEPETEPGDEIKEPLNPSLSENLEIIGKDSFGANETPEFFIQIQQDFIDAISDADSGNPVQVQIYVEGCNGSRIELFVEEEETSLSSNISIYRVTIPNNKTGLETEEITPGTYTLVVAVGEQSVEHSFKWGVEPEPTYVEPQPQNLTVNITTKPVLTAKKKHFVLNENPTFKFKFNYKTKAEAETNATSLKSLAISEPKKATKNWVTPRETIKTSVYYKDELLDIKPEIEKMGEGDFSIKIPSQRAFRAGLYKLKVELVKDGKTYVEEQDFTWGVLAINTHKSIYLPDETAFIGMAVLDDEGHMVCDADVTLTITDQDNKETVLSTDNGLIKVSPQCSVYGVTNLPDYYTNYTVGGVGTYVMTLTAVTADGTGTKSITDEFTVQSLIEFDVARSGPTRIYPPVPYMMNFTIKANKNYNGLIKEYVPALFEITPQEGLTVSTVGDAKILTWNKELVRGETYNIAYEFDAPDISPYLFVLGALEIGDWKEARQWQIASDAEVTIDNTIDDASDEYNPSPAGVFISDQVGYIFYIDATDDSVAYRKTTNGGTSWGDTVAISTDRNWHSVAIWYDRWTPGDTTGTKIHIVAIGDSDDMVKYRWLDTSDDSLSSDWVTVFDAGAFAPPDGGPSITKSTDGYLFALGFGSTRMVYRSVDNGDSWSNIPPGYLFDDDDDHAQLLPLSGGDVLCIYHDKTATKPYWFVWDETTDTWSSSATQLLTETWTATYDALFGGTVYKSTGDIYLSANNAPDTATGDLRAYKFTDSTRGWSVLTDIATDLPEALDVKMVVDENNGDLYAMYIHGGSAGSTTSVYYKNSTDGGNTWSAESAALNSVNVDDYKYVRTNFMSNERIYAVWYDDDDNDLFGNTVADLIPADTTPPLWQNPGQNNSAPAEGEAVLLYAQGKDETALDFAILETNETGGWLNITDGSYGSPMDMEDAVDTWTWSNFTWQNSSINAGTTVGWRIWYNDTSDNRNKTDIMCFTVQDTQAPQWSDAQTNKTPIYENDYVKFTANWTDDVALAGYKFSTNQSGAWENSSFVPFSGTFNISENITQITASAGTTVGWRFYANDTSDNGNVTDIQSFVVATPPPPPPTPYMIYGRVFYEDGSECNGSTVKITNLNNSKQWTAKTNASYNYYQITLAGGTDLNATEILQFNVNAPDASQFNTTHHTVTSAEIDSGGLFSYNITLEAQETPFMIYGWVNYNNGTACNGSTVNVTNTNTSITWQAETNASYNYYQLIIDTTNISTGNVLSFNATDGTEFNVTNHTVTQDDINNGGLFDFNLTLPTAADTIPPEWRNQGQNNSAPAEGEAVLLYAQGKDETALDFAVLETNETGGWLNITDGGYGSPMDMGDAVDTWTWSNFTWQNSSINAGTTVGWRIWYNDTSDNWNKTDIMSFTVQSADNNPPEWSDAQKNKTTIYENDYVEFTANWTDDVALAGYKFSINQTGTWVNSSFTSFSGTSNTSENVTQITASAGTTVGWRFYANDTSDNGNVTDIQSFVVATPPPPPSTPYMIYGRVSYKNGTACNNPAVNVTNMNNSKEWAAKTNASYNYYQLMLANGTDLNVSEILRFKVRDSSGVQSKMFNHTVNETEVNNGGLFNFNITLEAPETPFMIYGWVNYSNGTACNGSTVNITNTNTSITWQAETNASYNFYQLILDTTNISAGNVLEFNATDGTQFNVTNHTVTQENITDGGLFNFNLTLPSAITEGPTVDSITITPDDDSVEDGVQINPNPGANKTVNISAVVSDPNGWDDVDTIVANITGPSTVADSPVTLSYVSNSSLMAATYNGTFNMSFYYLNGTYTVDVTATDMSSLTGSNSTTFEYQTAIGLELDSTLINFSCSGPIDPGETSAVLGDENMSTLDNATVRNIGNVVIDVEVNGTNMTSAGNIITKDNIEARINETSYLDMSVTRCFDVNMTVNASSRENADFKLFVPYGTPQGNYSGTITLTAKTC